MLYTVMPLERIYHNHVMSCYSPHYYDEQDNTKKELFYPDVDVLLRDGYVHAIHNGNEYVVDRLHSTALSDYLQVEYSPGSPINIKNSKY